MAKFSRLSGEYIPPIKSLQGTDGCRIVLHMPFYFHLLQLPTPKYRRYFLSMEAYWKDKQKNTMVIAHCKGINKDKITTIGKLYSNVSQYARLCPSMRIQMENDAGGKTNPAPKLIELADVRRRLRSNKIFTGVCLDTEHAYAAGDNLFSINYRKDVTLIHLNAIPHFVNYGGHLDRHSVTQLSKSKNGTGFIKKILSLMKRTTPLVLERTDVNIAINDANLLKRLSHANLMDVDKKTLGKNLQKKTKVLL